MSDLRLPENIDELDPALRLPRADIEYLVWTRIRHLGDATCHMYSATEGDPGSWLTTTMIQVDCRSANRARALGMADTARRIIKALARAELPEVVISMVSCTEGPRWLPDENGGPRYIAQYRIIHHPKQGLLTS